jgi:hypothetical protein
MDNYKKMADSELMELITNGTADLARSMFDAYNEQGPNPWKTFDDRDVPRWDALNDQVRAKWVAAAIAAVESLSGGVK